MYEGPEFVDYLCFLERLLNEARGTQIGGMTLQLRVAGAGNHDYVHVIGRDIQLHQQFKSVRSRQFEIKADKVRTMVRHILQQDKAVTELGNDLMPFAFANGPQ